MYNRDEQNFHVFLAIMRKERGVTLKQLADGLCSESEMKRIVAGERLPEKLMRDRIMERLGVSAVNFEDYLQPDEYERMLLRQQILCNLETEDYKSMITGVETYEEMKPLGKLEKQFIHAMRFYILKGTGSDQKELKDQIRMAVEQTITIPRDWSIKGKVLAMQEILLWAAYVTYRFVSDNKEEEQNWRLDKLQDVLEYIRHSDKDSISKTRIFPKVALTYCSLLDENSPEELKSGLLICEEAIELLRKEAKLYYFLELLDQYQKITEKLSAMGEPLQKEKLPFEEWKSVIGQLYVENGLAPRTDSDVHLFMEPKSYAIGMVIRKRRKMYGLTRAQLCEGICSERTLMRIETMKLRTQMPIVRSLFERLGLNPDYTRSRVVTNNPEAIHAVQNMSRSMNKGDVAEGEKYLQEIEKLVDMDIVQNRQTIMKCKAIIDYMKKRLSSEDYERRMIEVLELTVPLEGALKRDGYLTEEELMCILNMGLRGKKKDCYFQFLYWYCRDEWKENRVFDESMTELLRRVSASYLGEKGEFDLSDHIVAICIQEALKLRRCNLLESNLYCLLWNEKQRCKENPNRIMKLNEKNELKKCITLTSIVGFEEDNAFLRNKLKELD